MDRVFTNSLCTIAAVDGPDSRASLFTARDPLVGAPFTTKKPFQNHMIEFTIIPDWVDLVRRCCGLFSRAWVVQERFLSPRILHLSNFPFYECSCGLKSEGWNVKAARRPPFQFRILGEQQREWPSQRTESRDVMKRWWGIVNDYTRSSLTYNSDKLVAIGGLARQFRHIIRHRYYAGIWGGGDFENNLLWTRSPLDKKLKKLAFLDCPENYRGTLAVCLLARQIRVLGILLGPLYLPPHSSVLVVGFRGW